MVDYASKKLSVSIGSNDAVMLTARHSVAEYF